MKIAQIVAVLFGAGLIAAPAVFGYAGSTMSDVHRTVGPVAASLGLIAAWEVTASVRWLNLALAAALAIAPLALEVSGAAAIVSLAAAVALGGATPFGGPRRQSMGGGWASLKATAGGATGEREQSRRRCDGLTSRTCAED